MVMDMRRAPIFANVFTGEIDAFVLEHWKPQLQLRYVDDTFVV